MSSTTITELLSDGELITASRGGDSDAYAELYRRHQPAALAAAKAICRSRADAEDLVAEGFARVLKAVQNGGGPDLAFRPYLLTAVRNTFYDRVRRSREEPTETIEDNVNQALLDFADDSSDRALAAKAFAALPERWQMVLWHTEVEGRPAAEVAPLLGLAPNAVAALAYRAREGLRQAYLQAHLQDQQSAECRACADQLGAYVRDGLSTRDRRKVDEHLEGCVKCRALVAELDETNSTLRAALIPALVGVPALAYLGNMSSAGLVGWYRRQPSQTQALAGAGMGIGVVAAAVALILAVGGGPAKDQIESAPGNLETTTTTRYVAPTTSATLPATVSTTMASFEPLPTVAPLDQTTMTLPSIPPMPSYTPVTIKPYTPVTIKPYIPVATRPTTPRPAPRPITPAPPTPAPASQSSAAPSSEPVVTVPVDTTPESSSSTSSSTTTTTTTTPAPTPTPAAISSAATFAADGNSVTFTLTNTGETAGTVAVSVPAPYKFSVSGTDCTDVMTCKVNVPGVAPRTQATNTATVVITIPPAEKATLVGGTPLNVTVDGDTTHVEFERRWASSSGSLNGLVTFVSTPPSTVQSAKFSMAVLTWKSVDLVASPATIKIGTIDRAASVDSVAIAGGGFLNYANITDFVATGVPAIEVPGAAPFVFVGAMQDGGGGTTAAIIRPAGGPSLTTPVTATATVEVGKQLVVGVAGFGGAAGGDDKLVVDPGGQKLDPFTGTAVWSAIDPATTVGTQAAISVTGDTGAAVGLIAYAYGTKPVVG